MKSAMRLSNLLVFLLLGTCGFNLQARTDQAALTWLRNDERAFARAEREDKLVLLYLEAVWCHWCHVMDHDTYGDARVQASIAKHFVPLRIDQDSRPDLANRYRDFGWPATIVLDAKGIELRKRRGFVAPDTFFAMLEDVARERSPEQGDEVISEPPPSSNELSASLRMELARRHQQSYDPVQGGLKHVLKFLDRDSVEWALLLAREGDQEEAKRARHTLDAALNLLDPAFGGFYQYSTHHDWQHPHFEKLTHLQADYLRIYAMASAQFEEPRYHAAVTATQRYLELFLSADDGAFFPSQDADLVAGEHAEDYFALDAEARRALGIPAVAKQRFTMPTAAVAESLLLFAEFQQDASAQARALKAVQFVEASRALPDGGFRHDEVDAAGPYLSDNLRMLAAYLGLYRVRSERVWLSKAIATAAFIDANFRLSVGFASAKPGRTRIAPLANIEENIKLGRLANLLQHYSGNVRERDMALHALRYLAQPAVAKSTFTEPGILLLDRELASPPLHVVVVASKSDRNAEKLFAAIANVPVWYKRIEWWDAAEGELIHHDVPYPKLKRAAAFVCTDKQCSVPLYQADDVRDFLSAPASD
jgi:hypothetical protein